MASPPMGGVGMSTIEVLSPRGRPATLHYRDDTSDLSTIGSTWRLWGNLEDEYQLGSLPPLTGTAIDIGAHIGTVACALLADHPALRVIAVEPLPDNIDVLRANLAENGWTDRATVIKGAIAKGQKARVSYDFDGADYLRNHRFIGNMTLGSDAEHSTVSVPAVRLSAIIEEPCPFLKVDCEGCEWDLLADPAIGKVERIVGEGHPADWLARVHKLLDATHEVRVITDAGGPGTFSAVRR
jgi:FkbM family methyltransferase